MCPCRHSENGSRGTEQSMSGPNRKTQSEQMFSALPLRTDIARCSRHVRFVCQKRTWWACRTLSVKTLNVDARQGGIASRGGRDADRVDCVRHSAVRVFPHVHHHRGDRLAYPADPEKRERALLAPLNVLFSCHCR